MEQKGVENPERFIQQVEQIPQEVQEILMQDPAVQQMIQGAKDAKAKMKPRIEQSSEKTPQEELEAIAQRQHAQI